MKNFIVTCHAVPLFAVANYSRRGIFLAIIRSSGKLLITMNIVAITQARFSSSRLPGKVLKQLGSETVLDLHLKRIKQSRRINSFILATTTEPESEAIAEIANRNGVSCFQGSLNDVLDRFYQAVVDLKPDYIVRLTSDCPLIDPAYIDDMIQKFLDSDCEYGSNCLNPTLPDGMDAEIFTFDSLASAWQNAQKKSEREHVTPYIRESGKFKTLSVEYDLDWDQYRMTLDTEEDYQVLKLLVDNCGECASVAEYVKFLSSHPEISEINSIYQRNEGYQK